MLHRVCYRTKPSPRSLFPWPFLQPFPISLERIMQLEFICLFPHLQEFCLSQDGHCQTEAKEGIPEPYFRVWWTATIETKNGRWSRFLQWKQGRRPPKIPDRETVLMTLLQHSFFSDSLNVLTLKLLRNGSNSPINKLPSMHIDDKFHNRQMNVMNCNERQVSKSSLLK